MNIYKDIIDFNTIVIGLKIPDNKFNMFSWDRYKWFKGVIDEELNEFTDAYLDNDLDGQVDAIIDMTIFALGRLVEMGVSEETFHDCWKKVHDKNMQKKLGNKGRGSDCDAIKPEGWESPVFNLGDKNETNI